MPLKPRTQVILIGVAWSILSALSFLRWNAPVKGWIFGSLASLMLVAGLLVPPLLRGIHRSLEASTHILVTLITWVLLGSSYYLILTPMGLLLRATGSLQTRKGASVMKESYWTPRPKQTPSVDQYLRSF